MSISRRTLIAAIVLVLAVCLVLSIVVTASAKSKADGAISGRVFDLGGKGVEGIEVVVFEPINLDEQGSWIACAEGVTTNKGTYTIPVSPGIYRVWFRPADLQTCCMEAYPDAAVPSDGEDVVVKAGKTTKKIDVTLDGNPGSIEGYVYDATVGGADDPAALLEGIAVRLSVQESVVINTSFGFAATGLDGYYRFDGLKPWNWEIWVNAYGDDPESYNPLVTQNIFVPNGDPYGETEYGEVSRIDAPLEPVGFVSVEGRLVDVTNPTVGVAGIEIIPLSWGYWDEDWHWQESVTTDENGYFEILNLPNYGTTTLDYKFMQWGSDAYWWGYYLDGETVPNLEDGWVFPHAAGELIDLGDWVVQPLEL